jgi:integrase
MQSVEAVKSRDDIAKIDRLLQKHGAANGTSLYADIWKFGINAGLRIGDLLSIKHNDIDFERSELVLIEQKTGKLKQIKLNGRAIDTVQRRKQANPSHTYLFQVDSNRAKGKPVSRIPQDI